jgi:parvulin-like peptidyl-prolyl isomerase
VQTPTKPEKRKKRTPQRAVPMSVRRSGKPLFFGWGAHLTHHEREQLKERLALAIGILIALAVAAILLNGWYQDSVVKPAAIRARENKPVAIVGGQKITTAWYHKVLHFRQQSLSNQLQQLQSEKQQLQSSKSASAKAQLAQINGQIALVQQQQANLQDTVLQELIDDTVIAQKGPEAGLKLSQHAEQSYLHNVIYNQAGGPYHFKQIAKSYGLSVPEIENLLLADYRRQQMQKVLAARIKPVQLEAHVREILVANQKTALKIARLLMNHQGTWQELARKYSQDPGTKDKGGDLGWFPHGAMTPPFDRAAFKDPIGDISIVRTSYGWHVIQVLGRGYRRLSPQMLQSAKQNALQQWLNKEESVSGYVKKFLPSQVPLPNALPPGPNGQPVGVPGSPSGQPVVSSRVHVKAGKASHAASTHKAKP